MEKKFKTQNSQKRKQSKIKAINSGIKTHAEKEH